MHHIYRTEVIILSSRPSGEAGKYLTVLSKDYGVLKIEAQAVRNKESKLRQSIQNYSVCELSFVRGKTGNRLIGAQFVSNFYYDFDDEFILSSLAKIFSLIEKMIVDEEYDKSIYELLIGLFAFLKSQKSYPQNILKKDFLKTIEMIVVYKLLTRLGYISSENDYNFIIKNDLSTSLIELADNLDSKQKKEVIRLINQAINESHL